MMNIMQMVQMFSSAKQPQVLFENVLKQNPQAAQMLNQIKNSTNGASPEQVARQMAQRAGIDENTLMSMYNSIRR